MFGISVFSTPEHFIALYLNLFTSDPSTYLTSPNPNSITQLQKILTRTKNPPISIIYTYQLLQSKTPQQYSLDFIRFLSQLSDLSDGTSMLTSLSNTIGQSSFLTQIRHNLTHKIKISQYLINICRKIIVEEIKEKYWDVCFKKFMECYNVDSKKIYEEYQKIYRCRVSQSMMQFLGKFQMDVINQQWLIKCTNYQYKQFIYKYYKQTTKQNQNSNKFIDFLTNNPDLTSHKKAITLSTLLRNFLTENKNEKLCQLIIKIIRKSQISQLLQKLVFINLKKLSFIHYIGLCNKILSVLPREVNVILGKFWNGKEIKLKSCGKGGIYKVYGRQFVQ